MIDFIKLEVGKLVQSVTSSEYWNADFAWLVFWCFVGIAAVLFVLAMVLLSVGVLKVITVKEATAVAFEDKGEFAYIAMSFRNHKLDGDGRIKDGAGSKEYGSCMWVWRWGGWVFYFPAFIEPTKYADRNGADDKFGKDVRVHLNDVVLDPIVSEGITTDNVLLHVKFVVGTRVVGIYDWLYEAPADVYNKTLLYVDSVLRGWVASGSQKHARSVKGKASKVTLWNELMAMGYEEEFKVIEKEWGLRIVPESIEIQDIGYSAGFKAALEAKATKELGAQGTAAELGLPAEIIMNRWVKKEAKRMGLKIKDAMVALKASGAYDKKQEATDMLRAQALAGPNFTKYEVDIASGGKSIDPNIAAIVGIAEVMASAMARGNRRQGGQGGDRPDRGGGQPPSGGQPQGGNRPDRGGGKGGGAKKSGAKKMTHEESEKYLEDFTSGKTDLEADDEEDEEEEKPPTSEGDEESGSGRPRLY